MSPRRHPLPLGPGALLTSAPMALRTPLLTSASSSGGLALQLFEDLNPPYYLGLSSNDTSWRVSFPSTTWGNSSHRPHDSIWFSAEHLLPSKATYSINAPMCLFAGLTCPFPQTLLYIISSEKSETLTFYLFTTVFPTPGIVPGTEYALNNINGVKT